MEAVAAKVAGHPSTAQGYRTERDSRPYTPLGYRAERDLGAQTPNMVGEGEHHSAALWIAELKLSQGVRGTEGMGKG